MVPELGCQHPIPSDRGAAALDMAQDDIAGLDLGAFFDGIGEPFGDASETDRFGRVLNQTIDDLFAVLGLGTFGDGDDREPFAALGPPEAVLGDLIEIELDLRDQNNVRPARDPGVEGDPPRVAAHELDDHHAVVTRGRRMHPIKSFGSNMDGSLESEGDVRAVEIVVDGFGDADAVEALVSDLFGDGHGAVAADDNEGLDFSDVEVRDTHIGEVFKNRVAIFVFADREVGGVGSVVGPDDGAAHGEDIGDIIQGKRADSVFDEPEEAVFDAENFDAVVDRVFGDGPDDGIEPRTIPPAGEDGDAFDI